MAVTRTKRLRVQPTPAYRAHEALGYAIGRLSQAQPLAQHAITVGYTRALREAVASGRVPTAEEAARELALADAAVAEAHRLVLEERAAAPAKGRARR